MRRSRGIPDGARDAPPAGASSGAVALVDAELDERFVRDGWALLDSPLSDACCDQVLDLYRRHVSEGPSGDPTGGFFPSASIRDPHTRAAIWDGLASLTRDELEHQVAPHLELVGGSFAVNPPGADGGRSAHQDPTVVDEQRFPNLSLWIPLQDVDGSNGALTVLSGSHRAGNLVRPVGYRSLEPSTEHALWNEGVVVPMRRGQVLAIDGALVHGSRPNGVPTARIAVIMGLVHRDAVMRYVRVVDGEAEIYEVGTAFYRSGDLLEPDLTGQPLVGREPCGTASWPLS